MKKFVVLFLALTTFLTSCKSDDDGSSSSDELSQDNLVGTYNVTKLFLSLDETSGDFGDEAYVQEGSNFDLEWVFTANGQVRLTGTYTVTETETFNNEVSTETYTETLDEEGTYELNVANETITINFSDDEFDEDDLEDVRVFNITSFTGDRISLESLQTFSDDDFQIESLFQINLER